MKPNQLLLLLIALPGLATARPLTVVLDPGHGGSNTGAPGLLGATEKQVTLAVARLLQQQLVDAGVVVLATRDRDRYLTLGERVRHANQAGADLFVSIHANATPDHTQRGVETYILARPVRDVVAARAAALSGDLTRGLIARARVQALAIESARLAVAVQKRLAATRPSNRGVRQAAYDVLDGVAVPAILVEIGFLDHPKEGVELLQPEVMARLATALKDGLLDFARPSPPALARR